MPFSGDRLSGAGTGGKHRKMAAHSARGNISNRILPPVSDWSRDGCFCVWTIVQEPWCTIHRSGRLARKTESRREWAGAENRTAPSGCRGQVFERKVWFYLREDIQPKCEGCADGTESFQGTVPRVLGARTRGVAKHWEHADHMPAQSSILRHASALSKGGAGHGHAQWEDLPRLSAGLAVQGEVLWELCHSHLCGHGCWHGVSWICLPWKPCGTVPVQLSNPFQTAVWAEGQLGWKNTDILWSKSEAKAEGQSVWRELHHWLWHRKQRFVEH